ncbi:nitroreductase [Streptomyces sp. NPDC053048]|uniref:nitroreductase n=1 Tax=Streptomyces sp. NPDC053048 TaxID=3365694 RepID=UPI0037CD0E0E
MPTTRHDLLSLITSRHSKRAFLERAVPRSVLTDVLEAAGHAPSSRNTQLWQVEVVAGSARETLTHKLCEAFDRGDPPRPDCAGRPRTLEPRIEERTRDADAGVLRARGADGTADPGPAARRELLRDNLRFYGAPVAMVFHLPDNAVSGTFLEMGFFVQNVMLGLVARGLGSCPQFSPARYADVLRTALGIGKDRLVVCCLAAGYVDEAAPVNRFVPRRARLEEYTRWHGWA